MPAPPQRLLGGGRSVDSGWAPLTFVDRLVWLGIFLMCERTGRCRALRSTARGRTTLSLSRGVPWPEHAVYERCGRGRVWVEVWFSVVRITLSDQANLLPAPRGCPRYFCPTPIILSIFLISRSIFFFHSPRKSANPGTQRVFFRLASLEQASIELRVRRANNRVSG